MRISMITVILTAALSMPVAQTEASTIIDFDALYQNSPVTTQYSAEGITFGTDARDTVPNVVLSYSGLEQSMPNVLSAGSLPTDGVISFSFTQPVYGVSFSALSIEDGATVEYYNASGTLLSSLYSEGLADQTSPVLFSYGSPDRSGTDRVSKVVIFATEEFFPDPDPFAIDDITFTLVPEPAGLGLLAMTTCTFLRRRR